MNWLAHLHLSSPSSADRAGNLLPDLVGAKDQASAAPRYLHGMALHRAVDRFTDAHPVVKRSLELFTIGDGKWRRFGGVLTDLFYDHFLSIHWDQFCTIPRADFIAMCYRDLESELPHLPEAAQDVLKRMQQQDWLGSYASMEGMEIRLTCVAARLRRPTPLEEAMSVLKHQFGAFERDFLEFYPALQEMARNFKH